MSRANRRAPLRRSTSTHTRPRPRLSASRKTASRASTPEDAWYEIKGIVAEKHESGRLWYKIDWADNPTTGEAYDPCWIPAGDATTGAITDWEREKRLRAADQERGNQASSSDSQPVRPPNWRSKLRSDGSRGRNKRGVSLSEDSGDDRRKRLKTSTVFDDSRSSGDENEQQPSKARGQRSDFLVEITRDPEFDPSEYIRFTSSQLSESNSRTATQAPLDSGSQQGVFGGAISQRTIPDSQDLSTSALSRETNLSRSLGSYSTPIQQEVVPPNIRGARGAKVTQGVDLAGSPPASSRAARTGLTRKPLPKPSYGTGTSGQDIPSHQPEEQLGSGETSFRERPAASRQKDSPLIQSWQSFEERVSEDAGGSGPPAFLTQPNFDFGFSATYRSSSASRAVREIHTEVQNSASDTPTTKRSQTVRDTGSGNTSQSAQVVPPLLSHTEDIRLEDEFSVYDDEDCLIRETAQETHRQQEQYSQGSSQALSEVDLNVRKVVLATPSGVNLGQPLRYRALLSSQDSQKVIQSTEQEGIEDEEHHSSHHPSQPAQYSQGSGSFYTCKSTSAVPQPSRVQDEMEGSTGTGAPLSAVDELKQLQAMAFTQVDAPLPNPLEGIPQAQSVNLDQSLISPSAILSSIEAEGASTSSNAVIPDSAAWIPDTGAAPEVATQTSNSPIPSSEMNNPLVEPPLSAVEELRRGLGLDFDFSAPAMASSGEQLAQSQNQHLVPATIAPSALVTSTQFNANPLTSIVAEESAAPDGEVVGSAEADVLASADVQQSSSGNKLDPPEDAVLVPITTAANEYVITLPLAANVRPQYLDTIWRNRRAIEAFSSVFTSDISTVPDVTTVADIDLMFQGLLDIGDLPPFVETLATMSAEDMKKHATGTNSKFSFVHELLLQIRDLDKQVVILSQPGRVLELIEAIVASEGYRYRRLDQTDFEKKAGIDVEYPLRVTIGSTDADASNLPRDVDVVISFDQKTRTSGLLSHYRLGTPFDTGPPIILDLVVAGSLEHVDLRTSRNVDPMERKNALLISTTTARPLIRDPDRGYPEPHEAAALFGSLVKDHAADFVWEPQDMPDEVFEVYLSSQVQRWAMHESSAQADDDATRSNSRKRQLHDAEPGEGTPKRARLSESTDGIVQENRAHLSLSLRNVLGGQLLTTGKTVEISANQLESLAARIIELEGRLKDEESLGETLKEKIQSFEAQVKLHEKTAKKIQYKYMEALKDRGNFEKERDDAAETAKSAKKHLESSKATVATLKEDRDAITEKLTEARARLTKSENPDIARLAQMEVQLQEEQKKSSSLEKRLESERKDQEYIRQAYQDASSRVTELGNEVDELRERGKELEGKASENMAHIHRINHQAEVGEIRRLWLEQQALTKERERELERVREELRALRNGRRETRQQSVPRSPRMGVISPRTIATGRGYAGGGGGGSASRGTSPGPGYDSSAAMSGVLGMNYINNQPGNPGRWGHLRD